MLHSTSWVASLSLYVLPLVNGSLLIQNKRALKFDNSNGGAVSSAAIAPRLTKICSVKVMPIDSPATAESLAATFQRSILLTVLVLFVGEKINLSPTLILPDSIRPARIRRSSKR